jgi:peptide/nickel transport system permease protein
MFLVRSLLNKVTRSRWFLVGASVSLLVLIVSLIGPFVAPHGPSEFTKDLLRPPSRQHLLGTDRYGQDLFSLILRGGSVTLSLAFITVGLAASLGIGWGIFAAYTRGVTAILLNRAIDVSMSFPSILTALFVLAIAGTAGKTALVVAIAFSFAPRVARVVYGSTLPILQEDFILAEKALGASHARILGIHVLPNLVAPITVLISIHLPAVILLEATLSFLGLGAPPDVPTWGRIISDGKKYMQVAPWLTVFPGMAIIITSLGFNVLGDGLRDLLDPKSVTRLYKGK